MARLEPYNAGVEECNEAGKALLDRSVELSREATEGKSCILNAIWRNMGFHLATLLLKQTGVAIPTGSNAQAYISLVIAAAQHAQAQEILEGALEGTDEPPTPSGPGA